MLKWHRRHLRLLVNEVSSWSKDQSTKVGALIIEPESRAPKSFGYNGFPRGIDDNDLSRHERPAKYFYSEHAERNAIYNCAKNGISTQNCILYTTNYPCADCTRAIIQSGISEIITLHPSQDFLSRWKEEIHHSSIMLNEVGISITLFDISEICED